MKLIIECRDGDFYAYRETEKHHKRVEHQRAELTKRDFKELDSECCLNEYPHSYFVVDI